MSGGGGSNKKKDTPATSPTQPMKTVQPAMPGQLDMLAQQLAMGGYGQSPDILSYLNQFYSPMRIPDYSPGAKPTPSPSPSPSPAPDRSGGSGRQRHFTNREKSGRD